MSSVTLVSPNTPCTLSWTTDRYASWAEIPDLNREVEIKGEVCGAESSSDATDGTVLVLAWYRVTLRSGPGDDPSSTEGTLPTATTLFVDGKE